jgi:hypothetical protein
MNGNQISTCLDDGDASFPWWLCVGMVIWVRITDIRRVSNLMGMGMGTIFYSWVVSVSDLNRDGYETDIFFHPWITRWIPDILLPL